MSTQCCRNPVLFVKSNCDALSDLIENVAPILEAANVGPVAGIDCAEAIICIQDAINNGDITFPGSSVYGSAVYDPPLLGDGSGVTTTVACAGAALGNFAQAAFSLDTQGIVVHAWVSAADVVSVRFQNESGGAVDLASGTLDVKVST